MILGIVLVSAGAFIGFAGKIPFIGKLPGDIYKAGKNFVFYFPVTTCILLSIIISLILWLMHKR